MKVNSYNDWDPLKEIIVGSAEGSTAILTWPRPEPIPPKTLERAQKLAREAYPDWFVNEVNEDLDNLANTIKSFGVKVHRPKVHDISKMYSNHIGHRLEITSTTSVTSTSLSETLLSKAPHPFEAVTMNRPHSIPFGMIT